MANKLEEWQHFQYHAYQFNHTIDIGVAKSITNPLTGISKPGFSKIATCHFARRNVSVTDRFNAAGTDHGETMMVVIRHSRMLSNMNEPLFAKLDGKLYSVGSYSVNDSTYNAVDLLTLNRVQKVG